MALLLLSRPVDGESFSREFKGINNQEESKQNKAPSNEQSKHIINFTAE